MLITPPNCGGGFGTYLPSTVVVAVGEPGVPVICWDEAAPGAAAMAAINTADATVVQSMLSEVLCIVISASDVNR